MQEQLTEEMEMQILDAEDQMKKAIQHLEIEITHVRAGRANPSMLDGLKVDYYGAITPLNQVANISTPDARTINIQPWEKKMLGEIEKAIFQANLGITPMNNGEVIRLSIPVLTEERRKDLVKQVKQIGEGSKVTIRNARKTGNEEIKKLQKNGLPEDVAKDAEDRIQKLTDKYSAEVEKHLGVKEQEIMTV
ncbi:MAG TPA: ribosome recycling factor [Chitinophagales bacterium]|nr:ribosome recycling factor [Chitinophagales bacterium]